MKLKRCTKDMTIEDRLRNYGWIVTDSGCWEWQGWRAGGYGRLKFHIKSYSTHRLAYELWVGPIPEGMQVLHTCDNPPCMNPEHLWLGTVSDNIRDCNEKGRAKHGFCLPGENNGQAKLTQKQVDEIRELKGKLFQEEIAQLFGVSQAAISKIQIGLTWKNHL